VSKKLGDQYGGRKGQELGLFREQTVIAWLARFRYSTYHVLALVMDIPSKAAAEKLYKMEKAGLIQKVTTLHARNHYVYRLTPQGLDSFKQLSERVTPAIPTPRDLSSNTRIPHDLSVQAVIAQLRSNGNLEGFLTTFEIYHENKKHEYKPAIKPDAILVYCGYRQALELERCGKSDVRLLGKYDDMRKEMKSKNSGVLDNHHKNMLDNQEDETEGFSYGSVMYVITDGSGERYRKTLRKYYNRRFNGVDNKNELFNGWFASYDIQFDNDLTRQVSSVVEIEIKTAKGLIDLL